MSSVNKAIILGRLGRDPEARYLPDGTCVANLSVATSYKPQNGDEVVEWHRCVAWDRLGEIISEYAKKGDLIYIEGRLQTRKWTDKDGNEKYTTEIVAERVQLIGRTQRGEGNASEPRELAAKQKSQSSADGGIAEMDDDIPF